MSPANPHFLVLAVITAPANDYHERAFAECHLLTCSHEYC